MAKLERHEKTWRLRAGGLELSIDRSTGRLASLSIRQDKDFVWTQHAGDVTVRDDRLEQTFGAKRLDTLHVEEGENRLTLRKTFKGAPWVLEEIYRLNEDALSWEAKITLDAGEYRSCAVSYRIPWPQPLYPLSFWAAKHGMPSAPHRYSGLTLEYGEVTSGIMMPALACYLKEENIGLLLAMPFDFRAPRFRFLSGYRDPDLQAEFDWLALAPGRPARVSLLLRATEGDWRPALGWLYRRYTEHFEPRSTLIDKLWGGHIAGGCNISDDEARTMAGLGMKWHEIHCHFPAYGNYHPEGSETWRSGHQRKDPTAISARMIRRSIANLKAAGIAAFPYIQVTGDGDSELLDPPMEESRIRDWYGNTATAWPRTWLMNSDPSLPFGRDVTRQIEGMVRRYPEMDGVFLDQAGYNFLDTAHDDGITAVNNRPAYMTGFNYAPHLERLSGLLHPNKAIIANAPLGIGNLKYIDGFMAEGSDWLCDQFQYFGIGRKPMFFLMYEHSDAHIELMFQKALLYAAGFTSYPSALPSKDLYAKYIPIIERLNCRRWVFDANPIELPPGFQGAIYRGKNGALLVSLIGSMTRLAERATPDVSVRIKTADIGDVRQAVLHRPGCASEPLMLGRESVAVQFDIPGRLGAGLVELSYDCII